MAGKNTKNISRRQPIKRSIERELWARTAGRCQFHGCNRVLYKSPTTQEKVNISEMAHVHPISKVGPRGHEPYEENNEGLDDIENLMLLCHDCHKTIDQDKYGIIYSVQLLQQWKKEHESRVRTVTGIEANLKSHVVFYCSNIGDHLSWFQQGDAVVAMFPERYPVSENPICLSMAWNNKDSTPSFWKQEVVNLEQEFERKIKPLINAKEAIMHFSLFSMAPIPLLIKLGTLFSDKIPVDTYQRFREPEGWRWQEFPEGFKFIIKQPEKKNGKPILVISLSDTIKHERIKEIMGEEVSIWELTVPKDHIGNDNIRNKVQHSMMRTKIRDLMVQIKEMHGSVPLSIFPAMANSCSVEMGRARMPKADMPWIIYDQNNEKHGFIKTLTIN
jgi:hypothetical protein